MLAGDLKALNESRRDMTDRVVDEANGESGTDRYAG